MSHETRVRPFAEDAAGTIALAKGGTRAAVQGPHRERGLWNFLTWSFFLSQVAVGNAFIGNAARAGNEIDLGAGDGVGDAAAKSSNILGVGGAGPVGLGEPQFDEARGSSLQEQANARSAEANAGGIELNLVSDVTQIVQADIAGSLESMAVEVAPDPGSNDGPGAMPGTPPIVDVDIGLPPLLDGVLPPLLETVDDLIDGLGSALDDLLVPAIATIDDLADLLSPTLEHVFSPVATIADGLGETLEMIADPLLAPIEGLANDLGEIVEPVGSIAGDILALADPIVDAAGPILSPGTSLIEAAQLFLDPALDAAGPVVGHVAPVAEPLLTAAAPILEPVSDIVPLGIGNSGLLSGLFGGSDGTSDALGLGGAIQFSADADVAGHDLFQGGAYTEYGLVLHDDVPSDAGSGSAGDPISDITLAVGALLGDDDDAGNGLPVTLSVGLHAGLGLRGFGDGWL